MQKRFRLRAAPDFAHLRHEGQVRRHPFWVLSYLENQNGYNRYGVIASKRIGNAVKRNRVRRHLREALRQLHPNIQPGYDIVVVARFGIVGQSYQTIVDALSDTLRRCQLISDETFG